MAKPTFFDEMRAPDGASRDGYAAIERWLAAMPRELVAGRQAEAEQFFRRIGITFNVYGDAAGSERLCHPTAVHRRTGRPSTSATAAIQVLRTTAASEADLALHLEEGQLATRAPTAHSRGLRVGNLLQVRAVVDEELEAVWNERKTPKEALDEGVERSNQLLRSFERAHKR